MKSDVTSVSLYTIPKCPFCNKLRTLLLEHKIPFTEFDITKDSDARSRIITRNNHTPTPQVEIAGRVIFDYTTEEALVQEIKGLLK